MFPLLEAEAVQVPEAASVLALPVRAHVVGAVLDHEDAVLIAYGADLAQLRAQPPQVRDDEGLGVLGNVRPHGRRIHQVCVPAHVGEARHGVEGKRSDTAEVHDRVTDDLRTGAGAAYTDGLG